MKSNVHFQKILKITKNEVQKYRMFCRSFLFVSFNFGFRIFYFFLFFFVFFFFEKQNKNKIWKNQKERKSVQKVQNVLSEQ